MEHSLAADQIMIDAKAPKGAVLPGGNGLPFDWRLVAQRRWLRPWMLAGGLTPDNVAEAIRLTGVRQVDVASGVESAPGVKDPARIAAFVAATRMIFRDATRDDVAAIVALLADDPLGKAREGADPDAYLAAFDDDRRQPDAPTDRR